MGLSLKINFLKGWPCPTIVDFVSTNTSAAVLATLDEGMIAHRDLNGKWVKGITASTGYNQIPYILWNGAAQSGSPASNNDGGQAFPATATLAPGAIAGAGGVFAVQANYGGVQGVSFINQMEVETSQYTGSPVFGDQLAGTNGVLKVAATNDIIIGICTMGVHAKPGSPNMITFQPCWNGIIAQVK